MEKEMFKAQQKKKDDWVGKQPDAHSQPCARPQMCMIQIHKQARKDARKGMVVFNLSKMFF
jgi:hypothetical protein